MTTTTYTPATEKQIALLTKLVADRPEHANMDIAALAAQGLDKRAASLMIDGILKSAPTAKPRTDLPTVPAGHYALIHPTENKTYFFKVDRPTGGRWAGYTFVKRISGDNQLRVDRDDVPHILRMIAANPLEASKRYGRETGVCGICHRHLTDPQSVADGIGPVCAKKF